MQKNSGPEMGPRSGCSMDLHLGRICIESRSNSSRKKGSGKPEALVIIMFNSFFTVYIITGIRTILQLSYSYGNYTFLSIVTIQHAARDRLQTATLAVHCIGVRSALAGSLRKVRFLILNADCAQLQPLLLPLACALHLLGRKVCCLPLAAC